MCVWGCDQLPKMSACGDFWHEFLLLTYVLCALWRRNIHKRPSFKWLILREKSCIKGRMRDKHQLYIILPRIYLMTPRWAAIVELFETKLSQTSRSADGKGDSQRSSNSGDKKSANKKWSKRTSEQHPVQLQHALIVFDWFNQPLLPFCYLIFVSLLHNRIHFWVDGKGIHDPSHKIETKGTNKHQTTNMKFLILDVENKFIAKLFLASAGMYKSCVYFVGNAGEDLLEKILSSVLVLCGTLP